MLHSRSFIHSDKVIGVKVTKRQPWVGPGSTSPPTLPTPAAWSDAPCRLPRGASSICDRELQVFYPFFWLHSVYFPVCSLSPVLPLRAHPALSAVTEASEICVFWAAVSVRMLVCLTLASELIFLFTRLYIQSTFLSTQTTAFQSTSSLPMFASL